MEDDDALVVALRAGDPAAFDAAYERYRARLFTFLLRLSRDRAVAEDLLQETWLRLARHAVHLEPGTPLVRWLFTVARNLYISERRWNLLDRDRLAALRLVPARSVALADDLAIEAEAAQRLDVALGELPLKYREAVLLVAVEALEPAAAAAVLGVAPEALRQRLARGRAMLREALGEGR